MVRRSLIVASGSCLRAVLERRRGEGRRRSRTCLRAGQWREERKSVTMACRNKTQSRSGPRARQPRTTKAPGLASGSRPLPPPHILLPCLLLFIRPAGCFFSSRIHASSSPFFALRGGRDDNGREFVAVFFIAAISCARCCVPQLNLEFCGTMISPVSRVSCDARSNSSEWTHPTDCDTRRKNKSEEQQEQDGTR